MSRRYVKTSKFNSLDQVSPKVVAVVTAKDNLQSVAEDQVYFKRNYLDAIRQIIPKFYFNDERAISGTHVSFPNQLVNSHILANKHQSTIFPVSAPIYDTYLSSINTPKGFAKYFSKQNPPAQIDTDDFQRNILVPLGRSCNSFPTSSSFASYISGTLLPSIPLVCDGHHADEDLAILTASAFANDSSGTYKYLANHLGWVYFLNRLGPTNGFDPSTALTTLLTDTLWKGRSLTLEDTINVYQEYLWKNQQWWTDISDNIIPVDYASATDTSAGIYTSGVQLLDRLKTLNTVVYSPHYLDSPDTFVKDSFDTYLNTSTATVEGTLITSTEEAGPLTRFLEAISFTISDRLTEEAEIGVLYDIGRCPQEFLELLGELIGWRFIGGDIDKWRVQLRSAVEIYKMKGTKKAIQYLLDTLFSAGVFNVTGTNTLNELWESYIPDLMYYSLATSSVALKDFDTYTPELAKQFGVVDYSPDSMETNIKYIVDKILFDLVMEFPENFYLGNKPFPQLQFVIEGTDELYLGPYHLMDPTGTPGGPYTYRWPTYMTGSEHDPESSVNLELIHDPDFIFYYRDRAYLVPPYEKRQYYTNTRVSESMIERIQYYLQCYGVDKAFAAQLSDYIRTNLSQSLDTYKVINNFMLFTKSKTYPPNYAEIIKDVTKQRTPDPVSLLSMWNGKSSHFLMNFESSSFDWTSQALTATSKYGMSQVYRVVKQVVPAHAIPEILLTVSDVSDETTALTDNDCREIRPNFTDLYTGSSTVPTGFGVCAVDMLALATANGIPQHRFKRTQVDNINDVLVSGSTFVAVPRNSLRRRNFHNLLPETKMFTRVGRNNPGSLELSSPYYTSDTGYIALGFMPSSLQFKEVALRQNDAAGHFGIGLLIDRANLHRCWDICQNLNSTNSVFGYAVSDTFASRAKQNIATSTCNTYGRRGQLQEILYVMNKVHDHEKYLQASSMVSGYHLANGEINPAWPSSSPLITPMDFSAWYAERAWISFYGHSGQSPRVNENDALDIVTSIGNHLINKESADKSLHYYEHFKLGRKVHELYNTYMFNFSGHGVNSNYNLRGGPNFFSHTFGPYIYNSNLDIDGSGLETSGYLAASSPTYEVDISYYGGSGVLSISGMDHKVGGYHVGTSAASDIGDLPLGSGFTDNDNPPCEFRNNNLVSAIELVDTSTPWSFKKHPIFSIFNLSRDDQSKYSYSKYLINNQIIKYHRSAQVDSLPRLRIKIDGSDINNMARNFLQPDHEYEITVKAHNLEVNGPKLGGQRLGCWIHTEPELDEVWSHELRVGGRRGSWERLKVSDLSAAGGIALATGSTQSHLFPEGSLNDPIGKGVGGTGKGIVTSKTTFDYRCWEPKQVTTIEGSDPQAIANINARSLNTLKFRFFTNNSEAIPSTLYRDIFGKVHRVNQKYTLEFFVLTGDPDKFVVFEDISIKDITNYNKSVIETEYGEAQLDSSDLKALFIFLKNISSGLASRNATNTSATMEVSGGSRLNYRSNIAMFTNSEDANYKQLEDIDIYEG